MAVEKLTHEEAIARVAEYFKGRCAVNGDAYAQSIDIKLPNGDRHSLHRSLYVRAHKLQNRIEMLSRMIDEWEAKPISSR